MSAAAAVAQALHDRDDDDAIADAVAAELADDGDVDNDDDDSDDSDMSQRLSALTVSPTRLAALVSHSPSTVPRVPAARSDALPRYYALQLAPSTVADILGRCSAAAVCAGSWRC